MNRRHIPTLADVRTDDARKAFEKVARFATNWVFVKFERQRREKRTDQLLEHPPIG